MKKGGWIAIILGVTVGMVVAGYFKVKSWVSQVEYGIATGVSVTGFTGSIVNVLLPIWIYNPTPFGVVFSNLNLRIYFNGYYVSNLVSPESYMIASKARSTYPITVRVDPKAILNLLAAQGHLVNESNWLELVKVKVEGTVDMDIGLFRWKNFKIQLEDNLKSYV